ncbi:Sushi, nidogen and EGF-like domain-containing protein 1 [Folsomia candida]|uniref:Sushi, nidogen and EGF-like domain-containing protein 1 n=1 Tax=Folsomia candida TaxID=158441 RepID=A0A226DFR8_FOLCA|nr:Sushi, nidogen and EGF-like domain-containing protein 1 [Folsomia candida]
MTPFLFSALGCGYPGAPAHSALTFSGPELKEGVIATYACERGFELLGPSRRVCGEDGTWSPVGIPFCVPIKVSCFLYGAIHSRRGPLCEGFLGTNKGINRTSSQSHVEAFSLAASVSSQRTRSRGKMSIFASSHSDSDSKLC